MSFAALGPLALAGFGALVGLTVLAFYLLRRTPKVQLVSSVTFWMRAAQSSRPRFLRASRVPWLAFLVSLLVALLLLGLLADPRFGRGVRGVTVIVVSAGRTMGAEERGERRADAALREVRRWVDRSTLGGRVAVVRAGMRPSTLLPLTEDPADLRRALEGAELTLDDGPADLEAAVALADRILDASGEAGQILVIADEDLAPAARPRAPVVAIPVGTPVDTLAVTDLTARRDPLAAGEYEVRVVVRSFAGRPAAARLRVLDGAVPLLDRRVRLRPDQELVATAQGFSSARAELSARLTEIAVEGGEDAFATDDEAFATVAPLEPLDVLLLSPGNDYLEAALAVPPHSTGGGGGGAPPSLDAYDVVVLDRAALPEGVRHPAVVGFAPRGGDLVPVGAARRPRVSATLAAHPVLRGLRLEGIRVGRAERFATEPGDAVLIRSGADALAVARETRGARTVAFGLDLAATDLVEREAFPLLVHHALSWATAGEEERPLPRRLGDSLHAVGQTVLGPDGEPVPPEERAAIRRQGLYHVGERAVAYSAAAYASPLDAETSAGRQRRSDPMPPLGLLVAGALLALLLLEWGLVHRGRLS